MDTNVYPVLAADWVFKGTKSDPLLYNVWGSRKRLSLTIPQYRLLKRCNGITRLCELKQEYSSKSSSEISLYLEKLNKLGAVLFSSSPQRRNYPILGDDPYLSSLHWEVTKKCNSNCLHCYQQKYIQSREPDLTQKKLFNIVDQLGIENLMKVGISGGEPLIKKDLFELLHYIESKDIYISSILTNGILLNLDIVDRVLSLKSKPELFISLDGPTPIAAMEIRGFDDSQSIKLFESLKENIRLCLKKGTRVTINTVVHKGNINVLGDMYDLVKSLGVSAWRIALGKETGACIGNLERFKLDLNYVFNDYQELIETYIKDSNSGAVNSDFLLQIEHFFKLNVFPRLSLENRDSLICDYEGKPNACCIKPNGDVVPCALMNDYVVGNIQQFSLSDAWRSKKMRQFKELKIKEIASCHTCKYVRLCCAGCRANASFLNNGDLYAKDQLACAAVPFFVEKVKPYLEQQGVPFNF